VRALRANLAAVASLRSRLDGQAEPVRALAGVLDACPAAQDLIDRAITPTGERLIQAGWSAELDQAVAGARAAKEWIAGLEARERTRTGLRTLKVGFNRVFGYYLEVGHARSDQVPPEYQRRQTLANTERYVTPELKEYETLVLNADARIAELERALFGEVVERLAGFAPALQATAAGVAELDVAAALAEVAVRQRYVRPTLTDDDHLSITGGRHPVVEVTQAEPFVPNDTELAPATRQIMVLTGPNMAGKSTYLRQAALIVLLAQIGSYVPAEAASIGLVDRIFTRVGARDDLTAGASTFMVEMLELAAILSQATPKSLLILDEIGRGTSTYDGISVARAVIEHLHNHPRLRARTIFATHYHELTAVARILPRVVNCSVAVTEQDGRVVFLRRIVPGAADRSYGVHVAELAGLPPSVTRRAATLLAEFERNGRGGPLPPVQLALLPPLDHPALARLRALDIDQLAPLDALTTLFELQRLARP
ncbi:MAG: DNA mismatch repair protein MutS, partial [Actinobacteria bacterium]|nr:DNA mismatch repair protein MutS [Actinomycetota bacterium]